MNFCSIYIEKSTQGHPYKNKTDFDIDWDCLLQIAQSAGHISSVEMMTSEEKCIISYWQFEHSYGAWLNHQYAQSYIRQRDEYNRQHSIEQKLIFGKVKAAS